MGMKVYGPVLSWNVGRVVLCLEEAGQPYELLPVDMGKKEHKSADFLARNPFGEVPVLQDGDLHLFESRACNRYVARKCKPELLKAGKAEEAGIVDVWMEVEAHQFDPAMSPILSQCLIRPMFGGTTDEDVVNANLEKLKKVLAVYEDRLSKHKYLAGESISLADINHVPSLLGFLKCPPSSVLAEYPHVKAWCDGLAARPAVQKLLAHYK